MRRRGRENHFSLGPGPWKEKTSLKFSVSLPFKARHDGRIHAASKVFSSL